MIWPAVLAGVVAALMIAAGPAAPAPIDDALMAANPCTALPGFDRTDSIRLGSVDISLRREQIGLAAEGDIACSATGTTVLRGNLTARVRFGATLDSATCQVQGARVDISSLGGTTGPALAPQEAELEELLSGLAITAVEEACRRSLAPFLPR